MSIKKEDVIGIFAAFVVGTKVSNPKLWNDFKSVVDADVDNPKLKDVVDSVELLVPFIEKMSGVSA
jgi:hypothetical protein